MKRGRRSLSRAKIVMGRLHGGMRGKGEWHAKVWGQWVVGKEWVWWAQVGCGGDRLVGAGGCGRGRESGERPTIC